MITKTKDEILSIYKEYPIKVKRSIENLIQDSIEGDLTDEQKGQLDTYAQLFNWNENISVTAWWKASINDVEDTHDFDSEEEAKAFLEDESDPEEPDAYDTNTSGAVEFDRCVGKDLNVFISQLTLREEGN